MHNFNIKIKRFLFAHYSWLITLLYGILYLLPPFLRWFILKLMLGRLGSDCLIDSNVYFRYPWKVFLGNGVSINNNVQILSSLASSEGVVTIKDGAVIAPYVLILTATHDYSTLELSDTSSPVVINEHAWIGAGSIILPGVNIGKNAVVGAGSVVTKDVPDNAVVAGTPSKIINQRIIK